MADRRAGIGNADGAVAREGDCCVKRGGCGAPEIQGAAVQTEQLTENSTGGDIELKDAASVDGGQVRPAIGDAAGGETQAGVVSDFQYASPNGRTTLVSVGRPEGGRAVPELLEITRAGDDRGAYGQGIAAVYSEGSVIQNCTGTDHARRTAASDGASELQVAVTYAGHPGAGDIVGKQSAAAARGGDGGVGSADIGQHQVAERIVLMDDQLVTRGVEGAGDGGNIGSDRTEIKDAAGGDRGRPRDIGGAGAAEPQGVSQTAGIVARGGDIHVEASAEDVG